MNYRLSLFFWITLHVSVTSAQCNIDVEDRLDKNAGKFTVLKRLEIKMKEIEKVPFSAQYTYVFTKENDYLFNMEYEYDISKELVFTLSNNDGEVLNSQLENVPEMGSRAWRFKTPSTGIYYLNFHTQQSFNACAAFQILKLNPDKRIVPCHKANPSKPLPGLKLLKDFKVDSLQEYEYSYVFSKGKLYHFALPSDDIDLTLLNADRKKIEPSNIIENKRGVEASYHSRSTGIVYIRLKTSGQCSSVGFYFKDQQ